MRLTALVSINGVMGKSIEDYGKGTKWMARASSSGLAVRNTMVISLMTRDMAMAFTIGMTGEYTLGSGGMESNMEKEFSKREMNPR